MKNAISSPRLKATVKRRGAELCGLKGADGVEYMWQADPAIWPRHAPILFPIVGKLANDRYLCEGKAYELKQHGFARDMDFELEEERPALLSYRLLPTDETRSRYPFEFELRVRYRVLDNCLETEYEVRNRGLNVMPFSVGAHPAFSLEWGNDDRIEDYFLEFEKPETASARLLDGDHLLSAGTGKRLKDETILPLSRDLFDHDALIFLDLVSRKISLCSRKSPARLSVEFNGFPFLGIWAKPAAPFVCIEPWCGHADPAGADGVLMNKPGIVKLKPGDRFVRACRIILETGNPSGAYTGR